MLIGYHIYHRATGERVEYLGRHCGHCIRVRGASGVAIGKATEFTRRLRQIEQPTGEGVMQCPHCKQMFANEEAMERHQVNIKHKMYTREPEHKAAIACVLPGGGVMIAKCGEQNWVGTPLPIGSFKVVRT